MPNSYHSRQFKTLQELIEHPFAVAASIDNLELYRHPIWYQLIRITIL
jgi:hypothetical protein